MRKLVELEFRRLDLRPYLKAAAVAGIGLLVFLHLFAFAPRMDPDPDLRVFAAFSNLAPMFAAVNCAVFAVLGAAAAGRIVVEEYAEKRRVQVLSYPEDRGRVMLAKLACVALLSGILAAAAALGAFGVFAAADPLLRLSAAPVGAEDLAAAAASGLAFAVAAAASAVIAAAVGYAKASVPAAVIAAVLAASLVCNVVMNSLGNIARLGVLVAALAAGAAACAAALVRNVKRMEA